MFDNRVEVDHLIVRACTVGCATFAWFGRASVPAGATLTPA